VAEAGFARAAGTYAGHARVHHGSADGVVVTWTFCCFEAERAG
jgi:hypothetical protein